MLLRLWFQIKTLLWLPAWKNQLKNIRLLIFTILGISSNLSKSRIKRLKQKPKKRFLAWLRLNLKYNSTMHAEDLRNFKKLIKLAGRYWKPFIRRERKSQLHMRILTLEWVSLTPETKPCTTESKLWSQMHKDTQPHSKKLWTSLICRISLPATSWKSSRCKWIISIGCHFYVLFA